MNKRRLLKLADLLEADASNPVGVKFDLETWLRPTNGTPQLNCGTAACAVGLACLSPEFNAEGLSFAEGSPFSQFTPTFDGETGFDAVEEFFDIEYEDTRSLFVDYSYPKDQRIGAVGERAVAARIRKLVDNYEPRDPPGFEGGFAADH